MAKRFKSIILSSLILFGGISSVSLSSCTSTVIPEIKTFSMIKDDVIDISTLLKEEEVKINEETQYSSENKKVARIIGNRIFALNEGTSRIEILDKNDNLIYSFDLKVNGYATYDDVKNFSKGINISGDLTDFYIGNRHAINNRDYVFTYEVTNVTNNDQEIQVVISNEDVIEFEEDGGVYHIKTKQVGNSIFEIINADGITVLKTVIKVRPELINEEEYLMALQKYDYWGSLGFLDGWLREDSSKVIFTEGNNGIFSGLDQNIILDNMNFTIELDTEWQHPEMVGFYVKNFAYQGSFSCKYMQLFKAGDQLMLYSSADENGYLLDMYMPKMNK